METPPNNYYRSFMERFIPLAFEPLPRAARCEAFEIDEVARIVGAAAAGGAAPVRIYTDPARVHARAEKHVMTLVVDIDETLVDARGETRIVIRPYARQFFELLRAHMPDVEIGMWTAGLPMHAERVARLFELGARADALEPSRPLFDFAVARGRQWFDERHEASPRKNIFILPGRGDTSVILDDSHNAVHFSGYSAVIVPPFRADERTAEDERERERLINAWYLDAPLGSAARGADAPRDDLTLAFALQVVTFLRFVICEARIEREAPEAADIRDLGLSVDEVDLHFFGAAKKIIGGGAGGRAAEEKPLVRRILEQHPFIARSYRFLPCGELEEFFALETRSEEICAAVARRHFWDRAMDPREQNSIFEPSMLTQPLEKGAPRGEASLSRGSLSLGSLSTSDDSELLLVPCGAGDFAPCGCGEMEHGEVEPETERAPYETRGAPEMCAG